MHLHVYHILIGPATSGLQKHRGTPTFSAQTNLLTDIEEGRTEGVDTWPKQQLLKTHGTYNVHVH